MGTAEHATPAAREVEQLGYRQELKRTLTPFQLLVYGLVFIAPIAPWASFGFVFNESHGMVPLVYVVGLIAMVFTAQSYATMAAAFPVAGSVYAYAGRGIGESVGFLAGWALLLDYMLSPTLIYVICAVAIHAVMPALPKPVLVAAFLAFNTTFNLLGIENTARMSLVMLVLQLALLAAFLVLCVIALAHGVGGAHLTLEPLFDPGKISPSLIFGALSLAVLSFLGFDAISTLTEEARGGARAIGFATMASLVVAALLFILQTYLASLFVLNHGPFPEGDQAATAFYVIAKMVGGEPMRWAVSILGVLFSGLASALTAQAATARLLYSMGRDGMLPRALARISERRKTPDVAILVIAALTLVLGVFLVNQLELLTSMVNFGALTGFMALHVSVVVWFMWRQRSRLWLRHLVSPVVGFAIIAYVLANAQANAKIAGAIWLAVGVLVLVVIKLRGGRPGLLEEEET
ncbi:MAG TPA: APC family permease, partial [Caulobacteraceae bacterium]|nr:APC family permease [Caulobacteraceae bacterium]